MTDNRDTALPPLFRRHTRRPRLTALLDEATAQAILVTAPAGYGKTTLAREWLQGRVDVAWYHATSSSADVGAFSAGLADVVEPIVPGAGERVRQRLRVGDATERLARPLAELLAEDLDAWPEDGILVLDDYHLMAESAPVEDFLDWLLTLAPIRVVVTTRRRPRWATARRFLYDEAVELGRDQLAMTDEEAAEVLSGRSTESVRALVRQAEGWPALIGLAALSADLEFPAEKVSESLFRYFAEEVLRGEPEDVQAFMLAASVPSAISARLAREALQVDAPDSVIERLRDEDLLHEVDAGEFRFHPLLRDFFRRRLQSDAPGEYTDIATRVVAYATQRGRWGQAFELAVEVDKTRAAEIAGRAARTLLAAGQNETLEKWLEACGAAAVTVAGASLARAEILIRKGDMSAAAAVAGDTAARLAEDDPDFAWACNLAGRALHFTSEEGAALERFEAARRTAKNDRDLSDCLWGIVLATAEIAPDALESCIDELTNRFPSDIDVRFRLAVGRALADEQRADLSGTWERFEVLLPNIEHARDPLAASTFLASAASVAVLRGQYLTAYELTEQALRLCIEYRIAFAIGPCHIYKAAAEIGLRRFAQARRSLDAFTQTTRWHQDPYFHLEAHALRARLLATQGASQEALVARKAVPMGSKASRPLGAYLGTLSIIYAARGELSDARRTAASARDQPHGVEGTHSSALAEAIADDIEGTGSSKIGMVSVILDCGRADYLDGFVLAYRLYPRFLEAAQTNPETLGFAISAVTNSRDFSLARRVGINVAPELSNEPLSALTSRERDVLGLLLEGLTNAEIADRLFISTSTAKVHVRHILKKLGARTRLEAVIRAQAALAAQP